LPFGDPDHEAVLLGVAHQRVDDLHRLGEVFLVFDAATAIGFARGFAVVVVDVDEIDIAGHVELAPAELAHAHHPHLGPLAVRADGRAVAFVELAAGFGAGSL
jgi:hypothetical protein